jgi:hypothetical protein
MEGGHPFEAHQEGEELEERLVAAVAENGSLDLLPDLNEDPLS